MKLKERLAWLQQTQKGLMDYLRDPDDRKTGRLSHTMRVGLCQEVVRIENQIKSLKKMPDWALEHGTIEGEALEIASGMNKNRQGVELRKMRQVPKITRTWSPLH